MTHLMTEQARAWLITIIVAALVIVALAVELRGVESDPCQAWVNRHGEPNERC